MSGCNSGSEAMFADLCYFSVRSVQVKQLLDQFYDMFPLVDSNEIMRHVTSFL